MQNDTRVPGEVKWAALRALMAELVGTDSGQPHDAEGIRRTFIAALRDGADVRQLCALTGVTRDAAVAILVSLARSPG